MATRISNDRSEIRAFNVNGEASSFAAKWKGWRRAFKLYVAGKDIKDDKQQKALLLHIAGLAVQKNLLYSGEDRRNELHQNLNGPR